MNNQAIKPKGKRFFLTFIVILLLGCLTLTLSLSTALSDEGFSDIDQSYTNNIPISYHSEYNIGFFGLEKFHYFDSKKYGRIHGMLNNQGLDTHAFIEAKKIDKNTLLLHHTPTYLDSLSLSGELARITELNFLRFLPSKLVTHIILKPKLYQTGGSIMAALAALEHGWAINLGGGFHHASEAHGEGFCALADIGLIIKYLRSTQKIQKAMIIDLDAHQGNGHELDFFEDKDVYIFDIYNKDIYPGEHFLKAAINKKVELPTGSGDEIFKKTFTTAIDQAFSEFNADIIIYIAGSDILQGDPLGRLNISSETLIQRDELVFKYALDSKTPIVMLLGGGYQKSNAAIIAKSITNLIEKYKLLDNTAKQQ